MKTCNNTLSYDTPKSKSAEHHCIRCRETHKSASQLECPFSVHTCQPNPASEHFHHKTCAKQPPPPNHHPSPLHSHCTPAHLGSGLGVPDLHELVMRSADDMLPVWREINRHDVFDMTLHRALGILDELFVFVLRGGADAAWFRI